MLERLAPEPSSEEGLTCLGVFRKYRPLILMVLSCAVGVWLLRRASIAKDIPKWQITGMNIAGSLLMMPVLYMFFALYQGLLRPPDDFPKAGLGEPPLLL